MNPYEMMLRSGVMAECRPVSRWKERAMINKALKDIMPQDKSWQVILLFAVLMIACAVLFARWWLCV